MKKFTTIIMSLVVLVSLSGCSKSLEKRLVGEWIVDAMKQTITTTNSTGGLINSTSSNTKGDVIKFNDGGTGTWTSGTTTDPITWKATETSVTISTSTDNIAFTVQTNEKKKQSWSFDYSETMTDPTLGTLTLKMVGTIDMSKQ